MPGVLRTLHVAKPNAVHATLDSGVVSIAHVAKPDVVNTTIRHCARSYDIRLPVLLTAYRLRVERTVHVAKPNDIQTTLGSVAKLDDVHMIHCARSSRRCTVHTSRIPMASIRHRVHVYTALRLGVDHSVYVAKPDVVNPTRCRRLYDLRLCIERTVHVAKPDDIQTTLGSVAKTDGVHRTLGSVAKPDGIDTTHAACS